MTEYHKLVRDRIPEIIRNGGEKPNVRILDKQEYLTELERKLDEETAEFHSERNLEELADILEVVYALTKAIGYSKDELLALCDQKRAIRGGFEKRIFLVAKE